MIAANWMQHGEPGISGDANFDGFVDIGDVQTVGAKYTQYLPPDGYAGGYSAGVQAVPEPSSFVLAALGILGLIGWSLRRRGNRRIERSDAPHYRGKVKFTSTRSSPPTVTVFRCLPSFSCQLSSVYSPGGRPSIAYVPSSSDTLKNGWSITKM